MVEKPALLHLQGIPFFVLCINVTWILLEKKWMNSPSKKVKSQVFEEVLVFRIFN